MKKKYIKLDNLILTYEKQVADWQKMRAESLKTLAKIEKLMAGNEFLVLRNVVKNITN